MTRKEIISSGPGTLYRSYLGCKEEQQVPKLNKQLVEIEVLDGFQALPNNPAIQVSLKLRITEKIIGLIYREVKMVFLVYIPKSVEE